jgi:hypothetical protein
MMPGRVVEGLRSLLRRVWAARVVVVGFAGAAVLAGLFWGQLPGTASGPISYNEDVRPILNKKCLACHGGVRRKGGLSLLFRTAALDTLDSGKRAIVPGKPGESEIMRRITHPDPSERMPPDGKKPLKQTEIQKIRRWIAQGAKWEKHWAYVPPEAKTPPEVSEPSWPNNAIDRFVLARLDEEGIDPAPRADCATLLRRVHLDLVGLPPRPAQARRFCEDPSQARYEAVVDSLLASKRFGERWATTWLDLARYADTKGYERDPHRSIWKYRDWVIRAFNEGLPFDRFTVEQLAGDLLPQPSKEELIATAFHRNTMTNTEGGTSNEEYRVQAVIDRLNTTMSVWQATTIKCVQCHSHPYDPFRHEEFYKLYAFFNNAKDHDRADDRPRLPTFSGENAEKGQRLRADIQRIQAKIDSLAGTPELVRKRKEWDASLREILSSAVDMERLEDLERQDVPEEVLEVLKAPGSDDLVEILKIVNTPPEERAHSEKRRLIQFYSTIAEEMAPLREKLEAKKEALAELDPVRTPIMQELPEGQHRVTQVFKRGNWLTKGDTVEPDVPGSLNSLPDGSPASRLGLARWLVSPENPLTARVTVNRFWAQIFGKGIVKTVSDFGTQGADPTHPALLDWLAVQFMTEQDWSMKRLLKTMVMSATYQQSSRYREDLEEIDPNNKLWARAPRFRLSAEQVRDQALAVGGLLSDKMFGPSVMPPQPDGIWNNPYSGMEWETSTGEDRYRRGVYTYWKRTAPYPSMSTFDRPSREVTTSRRIRTNTPLQALVTMNDPVYVEAARGLAQRMVRETGGDVEAALERGYRLALIEAPSASTLRSLRDLYEQSRGHYRERPDAVEELRGVGALEPMTFSSSAPVQTVSADPNPANASGRVDTPAEMAALTMVAKAIMNLDRFIMKE